jgi:hypothetical protein
MLTIPARKMQLLENHSRAGFEDRVFAHAREHFADQMAFIGPEWPQRLFVRDAIQSAWYQGFELEQDIVRYVGLVLLLGRDFDLKPQLHKIAAELHAPDKPAATRLDAAWDLATAPEHRHHPARHY